LQARWFTSLYGRFSFRDAGYGFALSVDRDH